MATHRKPEAAGRNTATPVDDSRPMVAVPRLHPGIRGLVVTADPEIVRKLPPHVRSRLYVQLASTLNFNQASDLVYTKNGTSPMAPWTIVSLDYLKGYYKRHADDLRLIYHRRNDL